MASNELSKGQPSDFGSTMSRVVVNLDIVDPESEGCPRVDIKSALYKTECPGGSLATKFL